MVTEDYVSDEIAQLLSEKGFDYSCANSVLDRKGNILYPKPTHQMTLKWLREIHNIDICICREMDMYGDCFNGFGAAIFKDKIYQFTIRGAELNLTFEEATERAVKYCLTELIK